MTARMIDGRALAREIRAELARRIAGLTERGRPPGLAVLLIGEDPASEIYVRNKERAAKEVGIASHVYRYPIHVDPDEVYEKIRELRADERIDGILTQWPVPPQIDFERVVELIGPEKDVDGFHPLNLGRLAAGREGMVACTPRGVMEMLRRTGIDPAGRRAVVVGRSNTVGKPLALLLLRAHATVTVCHSRTQDLGAVTREADILVAAAGRPRLITADMVKPGAVVIDVGIHRAEGGLVGDVDAPGVAGVASYLTPVPGGVGPMTIALLLVNTVEAAERNISQGR